LVEHDAFTWMRGVVRMGHIDVTMFVMFTPQRLVPVTVEVLVAEQFVVTV